MKTILPLLACILFAEAANSTHLMGGQITASPVSGRTYQVTMTLYRDTYGIPMYPSETIQYQNADSLALWTDQDSIPSVAVPFINATEEYTYVDTITFPRDGKFKISYSNCCRNNAILNGPANEDFYLQTILEVDSSNPNTTPLFLNKPITLAGINSLWTYNPLPYDADGDSIAWHLTTPLMFETSLCTYVPPFADSTQPFTLDSLTGQVTWIPNTLGNFVASFLVEEFRSGVKIGEIRRDMQMIVVAVSGARATIATGGWPVNGDGHFEFALTGNQSFSLTVSASDSDLSMIDLSASGEPFLLSTNPALHPTISSGPGYASLQINWTPSASQQRNAPYIVTVRCNEWNGSQVLSNDITLLLRVSAPNGLPEPQALPAEPVYPNPVNGELFIPISVIDPTCYELVVYNTMGQETNIRAEKMLAAGKQVLRLDVRNLSAGIYFLRIIGGQEEAIQRFQVTR